MKKYLAMFVAVACILALPITSANARGGGGGGGTKVTLTLPADWPASAFVPNGKIKRISRDVTGTIITVYVTTERPVSVEMPALDEAYASAGYDPSPQCPACRDYYSATVRVFVDYTSHDEKNDSTDLVMTAYPR